jgi:toluene monooxygenase system ferredoxin subunit
VDKTRVCRVDECPRNGMKTFEAADGRKILVAHAGGEYFGDQASCPHMDVFLEEGFYDGSVITCHQHLWQWDVRTGGAVGLAEAPLTRHELVEEDALLYVVPTSPLGRARQFSGRSDRALDAIASLCRRESFDAGHVLYGPSEPADDLCVLESGRVQFTIGHDGRTSPAGFSLQDGEVFGWNALLEDQPSRIATATCLERSSVLFINGRELARVFEREPAAGYPGMRRLASLITRHLLPAGAR